MRNQMRHQYSTNVPLNCSFADVYVFLFSDAMTQRFWKTSLFILVIFQVVFNPELRSLSAFKSNPFPTELLSHSANTPRNSSKKREEYAVTCSGSDECKNKNTSFPLSFNDQLLQNGKWNASMLIQAYPLKKEISVSFELIGIPSESGEIFEVYLLRLVTDDCNGAQIYRNGYKSLKVNTIIKEQTFNYTEKTTWVFFNVSAGSYCIKVYPKHCWHIRVLRKGKDCTVLNSAVVLMSDLAELKSPVRERDPDLRNWQDDVAPIVIVVAVVLFLSTCNYILFKFLKSIFYPGRPVGRPEPDIEERRAEIVEMMTVEPPVRERTNPFILFCPEKNTEKRISALKKILSEGAGIKVDSSKPHLLAIYGRGAVQSTKHNKIIIVETDQAIALQQKREQMWYSMLDSTSGAGGRGADNRSAEFGLEDVNVSTVPMENHFVQELSFLTSDMSRSLKDYCHIFVVQFKGSVPTQGRLKKLVPNERYVLPDHMLQFCHDLLEGQMDSPVVEEKLRSAVEKHWKFN